MTPFAQNFAVLFIVGSCLVYVGYQLIQSLRGRNSKLGSCCAKGCSAVAPPDSAASLAVESQTNKPAAVQFLPLGNVGIRPRRQS